MRRFWYIGVFILFVLAWIVFHSRPGSLREALMTPLESMLGSQKRLNTTLLEVSETAEPVRSASRRLLQPLGSLTLTRIIPAKDDKSDH